MPEYEYMIRLHTGELFIFQWNRGDGVVLGRHIAKMVKDPDCNLGFMHALALGQCIQNCEEGESDEDAEDSLNAGA